MLAVTACQRLSITACALQPEFVYKSNPTWRRGRMRDPSLLVGLDKGNSRHAAWRVFFIFIFFKIIFYRNIFSVSRGGRLLPDSRDLNINKIYF